MAVLQSKTPCIASPMSYRDRDGYAFKVKNKRKWRHHRLVWTEHYGEIPEGLMVRHLCHNPECINIEHLALGTAKENRQDDIDIGRNICPPVKRIFTDQQIYDIRNSQKSGEALSKEYGVSASTIGQIKNHKTYKHLP